MTSKKKGREGNVIFVADLQSPTSMCSGEDVLITKKQQQSSLFVWRKPGAPTQKPLPESEKEARGSKKKKKRPNSFMQEGDANNQDPVGGGGVSNGWG